MYQREHLRHGVECSMEAIWDVDGHRSPAQLLERFCIQNQQESALVLEQSNDSVGPQKEC